MELREMIVIDKHDNAPYQFWAQNTTTEMGTLDPVLVSIVMPLGGSQSAFFRYPKKGEKVLVGIENNKNYLMGYLPENEQDNIYTDTNEQVLPDGKAGQFFRYKGPKDSPDEKIDKEDEYSEIGFYHEPTCWDSHPKVTTMKIKSTGDIHQRAANYHQTKAKRFELLVGCDGSKNTDKESSRKYAFGDQDGDLTEILEGDAHIRAKKRVVIKAGKEIVLEVGRSSIIINDSGIKIASRKTRSNIQNGWDSLVLVDALNGVDLFGQRLTMRSGVEFELSEAYGGKIGSTAGITRIQGMDVRLSTLGSMNYFTKGVTNGLDFVANCVTMILGMAGVGSSMGSLGSATSGLGLRVIGKTALEKATGSNLEIYDFKGAADKLVLALTGIFAIYNVVSVALEMFFAEQFDDEDNKFRDIWNSCWAFLEYGVTLIAFGSIFFGNIKGAIHESAVHLAGSSDLTLDAMNVKVFGVQKTDAKSAMAALSEKKTEGKLNKARAAVSGVITGVKGK